MKSDVAWIDRTGTSFVSVMGDERIDFLHRITSNDLTGLKPGEGNQTVLLTEKARIIDVLTVLQFHNTSKLIFSKGAANEVLAWLRKYVIMEDVRFADNTAQSRMIEVAGPQSAQLLNDALHIDVAALKLYSFVESDNVTIVRMPSIWEVSYYVIYFPEADSTTDSGLFEHFVKSLQNNSDTVPQLSTDAAEVLRIRKGLGKRGNEWTDAYNPLEAALLHITSFTKGCYIGQEVIARLDSYNKVKQRLMGLIGVGDVSKDDAIYRESSAIGTVTSSVRDALSGNMLALGYIRGEHAHPGTTVNVVHGNSSVVMQLQSLPMDQ
jgi:folate-binding protein YgfZ